MEAKKIERKDLAEKVIDLLANVLEVEKEDLKPDTLLFKELAIESAETLEITFRLEQEFDISIGEGEFWNIANLIANEDMINNGKFTDEAKDLIKDNFSISDSELEKIHSPFEIYDYISIDDLVNYLVKKTC